jgi:hypothetical protein
MHCDCSFLVTQVPRNGIVSAVPRNISSTMPTKVELLNSGRLQTRALLRAVLLLVAAVLFGALVGCSSSGSSPTTTAPTNLVYPQTTIAATTGQAISTNTPTVTGPVTTYSVAPALPAGLSLNPTTGAISGSPTGASSQASYTITASNSSGSTTATVQITVNAAVIPPTNLVYPQTSITATVGQAITTDTPTVSGAVTAYSVTPALPAGLSLSTTTGAISGTPTTVAAQATYTVTATNSAGSATATVNILVNAAVPPPSALAYPQNAINAFVGQAIPPDIPVVTGTVTSFSINPALPAGLSFSTANGAITGTGTAASPQTTYTVTASNSGGSTTATLTVAVVQIPPTLLDVGHANTINQIRISATNVLSQDTSGHWVLWNYASNSEIASGDSTLSPGEDSPFPWPVDMANQIFVIGQTNALDVRSTADGHLLFEIQSPQIDPSANINSWWKLATDGSYVCSGTPTGLTVWSSAGQKLFTRSGDYSGAAAFAAPGQVLIAFGPAGENVIETVLATDGTSSSGPAFSGSFHSWFLDGQRFLTNTGTTVWVYSASGLQQSIVSLPTIEQLAGEGNWFWTYQASTSGYPLNIYAVGANTPSASYALSVDNVVVPSGNTLGILPDGYPTASVVDLSGSTPVKTDYPLPIASESAYGAISASQWIVGNQHGVVLDGASASTTPRYFGTGQVWSMAGSTNLVAFSTANGIISYYSPSSTSTTPVGTISFSSSEIALSSDGTILAAMANSNDFANETDRSLKVFSLPSGNLIYSIPFQLQSGTGVPTLFDFSLSGSGTVTGLVTGILSSYGPSTFTRQAAPTTGGAVLWSDNPPDSTEGIMLSPDGTLIAVSTGPKSYISTTNVFKNGILVTAVNGFAIGWIDNNQLLTNNYTLTHGGIDYTNASIYSATGTSISTPTLPELFTIQPVNSSSLYSPVLNTIFALPSGNKLYSSSTPVTGPAAVAGSDVVFTSGNRIVVDTQ